MPKNQFVRNREKDLFKVFFLFPIPLEPLRLSGSTDRAISTKAEVPKIRNLIQQDLNLST